MSKAIAYWAHLLFPFYLALDTLLGQNFRSGLNSDALVLIVSIAWLVAGAGSFLLSRNRAGFLRRITAPLGLVYVSLFCLVFLEGAARFITRNWKLTLYDPGTRLVLHPDPKLLPGIDGTTRFSVNEVGLRGPSAPAARDVYRIVTIGGSTTECYYLDDARSWPALVMEKLNGRQSGVRTWVANAGISGHTTIDHLNLVRNLPVLRQANLLIFLIGANDVNATIAFDGAPTQRFLENRSAAMLESLRVGPSAPYPAYKHLRLFLLLRKVWHRVAQSVDPPGIAEGPRGGHLVRLRAQRAAGPVLPLPDLRTGLAEYRNRISALARECQAQSIRCLFLTQPALLRNDLSPAETAMLWFGNIGRLENPKGYVTPGDLGAANDAYNQALLATCREQSLECLDLASMVPKKSALYYDDWHYNDEGAQVVADGIVSYLLSTAPFTKNHQAGYAGGPPHGLSQ